MHRLLKVFFLFILFSKVIGAKEPYLAFLVNISTNDMQEYKYENYTFMCETYGIISLDEMYRSADDNSTCKNSIEKFYKKRKDLKYYSQVKLHLNQSYSLILKEDNRCIVNISGEKSLSEFLLEEGIAVVKEKFQDKEYYHYFQGTQRKAKENKVGIWKENVVKDCTAVISKKR